MGAALGAADRLTRAAAPRARARRWSRCGCAARSRRRARRPRAAAASGDPRLAGAVGRVAADRAAVFEDWRQRGRDDSGPRRLAAIVAEAAPGAAGDATAGCEPATRTSRAPGRCRAVADRHRAAGGPAPFEVARPAARRVAPAGRPPRRPRPPGGGRRPIAGRGPADARAQLLPAGAGPAARLGRRPVHRPPARPVPAHPHRPADRARPGRPGAAARRALRPDPPGAHPRPGRRPPSLRALAAATGARRAVGRRGAGGQRAVAARRGAPPAAARRPRRPGLRGAARARSTCRSRWAPRWRPSAFAPTSGPAATTS